MAHKSAKIPQLPAHSYHYNKWGAHFIMSLSTAAVLGALGLRKPTILRDFKSIFHLYLNLLNLITVSFTAGANSLCATLRCHSRCKLPMCYAKLPQKSASLGLSRSNQRLPKFRHLSRYGR